MDIIETLMWLPASIIGLCWVFYLYLTWNHDYWKKRGVPYIKPLPFFGNNKDTVLAKKSVGEVAQEFYLELEAYKYGGTFNFGKPTLFIRDPELIKDVLVREFTSFHDNEIQINVDVDPMFGRNPFVLRGERWKVTRSRLIPAFTVAKLKPLFPLVAEVCKQLKELLKKGENSGVIETKELCARFTTDVVASCAFGINGNSIKDPNSEFRRMGKEIINPGLITNLKFTLAFLAPKIADILKIRFIPSNVEKFFIRMVNEVMEFREEKNTTRNDYLQHLINLKNKTESDQNDVASEKYPFKEIDVAAQATTFFIDGFETSSLVLSFTLYCLATNPDVQAKVRDEVNTVVREHGGELTFDGIQKMTYLDMVLSETLRMYSPLMVMTRVCTKPFKLEAPFGGEYTVEVDTPVSIPVYALHYDPKYYPNPKVFDPERFSEENKKERPKYVFLPFGEGPRICLGSRFAQMQVKACAAAIVSSFELSSTERTPIPVIIDPAHFILSAKGGLWVKFIPLSD